jgi:hypothetical protein
MTFLKMGLILGGVLFAFGVLGCGDDDGKNTETFVTIQGQVDDGLASSPIARAACQFVRRNGQLLDASTADANGVFQLQVPPGSQGFIGCHPPAFPNLLLTAFVSTVGAVAGQILPAQGFEEVSPRTTVVAGIIVQTAPANPQSRKRELMQALARQDADLTALAGAAAVLFTAMFETQVTDVDFSTGEGSGDGDGGGGPGGGGDDGGVAGGVGDGGEFSPLRDVFCEFTRDLQGDSALEDLFTNGTLDLQSLQPLTTAIGQNPDLGAAFTRYFPNGAQPLRAGQPLWTRSDRRDGTYSLPVPSDTPGFVRCIPKPELAITAFIRGRRPGSTLGGQDVSPPSHLFAAVLLPRLAPQDVRAIQENFLTDIGNLREPADGVIEIETEPTDTGPIMADTDNDGIACEFVGGVGAALIDYAGAGGAALVASTLFKGLLVEASNPSVANVYTILLQELLTRTLFPDAPLLQARGAELVLGGVTESRAPDMAETWNICVRSRIVQDLQSSLEAVARAGRLRVVVRTGDGLPVPEARVAVAGAFVAADSECSTLIESSEGRLVCQTNRNGRVTFTLRSETNLGRTSVRVTVRSADGALRGQEQTDFTPVTTKDLAILVGSD